MTRAVVFAYHDVGVRALRTLLAHGIDVPLVFTHEDAPGEQIWFESVARHAAWHGLPTIAARDPNTPQLVARVRAARPDFLFSFYYRALLGPELLALPARGAYNLHGSLLPRYRGRAPVNWAVLNGETETGATLHVMTDRPDAGDIVGRQAVPILPDDTALEVFRKVTVAAELLLHGCLPALVAGTAAAMPQDPAAASYFGRRSARDGCIDWRRGARAVHNLIRAVAPPYPGAFSEAQGMALTIQRTLPVETPAALRTEVEAAATAAPGPAAVRPPLLRWYEGTVYALCADGALKLLEFDLDGQIRDAAAFQRRFGEARLALKPALP